MILMNRILNIVEKLNMDFKVATNVVIISEFLDSYNIALNETDYKKIINRLLSWETISFRKTANNEIEFFSNLLTWEKVIESVIFNKVDSEPFKSESIYMYEKELSALFPNNNNIRAKIRQTLQRLTQKEIIFKFETDVYYKSEEQYITNIESLNIGDDKTDDESLNIGDDEVSIYDELKNICETNYEYYINFVFFDNTINEQLTKYKINKIKDFVNIEYLIFIDTFNSDSKLKEAKEVITSLRKSIKNILMDKYVKNLNLTLSQKDVIYKRAKGITLESIAKDYDVTRERIRQVENTAKKKYINQVKNYKHNFLKTINQTGSYIKFSQMQEILNEHADFVIYMISSKGDFYRKIITLEPVYQDFLKFVESWYKIEANNIYSEEELVYETEKITEDFNQNSKKQFESEIAEYILKKIFLKEGLYYFKVRPTLLIKYDIILKNHFDLGLTRNNIDLFKNEYNKVFPEDDIINKSDRSVFARVVNSPNIVPIDKGTYVYRKKNSIELDAKLISNIKEFIKYNETVYIATVFEHFKESFEGIVSNRFELHHILKETFTELYVTKDIISIYENPSINVVEILEDYAKKNNGLIDLKNISNEIITLKGVNLDLYIAESKNLFFKSNNFVIHKDTIKYDQQEMEKVKSLIEKDLNKDIPVRTNKVFDYMKKYAKTTFEKNEINRNNFAYNVFKNYYINDFIYDYPFIKNSEIKIGNRTIDYIMEEFSHKQVIKITEIFEFISEMKLKIISMKETLEVFYTKGYMRMDEVVIAQLSAILNPNVNYIFEKIEKDLLQRLNLVNEIRLEQIDLTRYPKINIKWNNHLVAHLLMNMSDRIEVDTIGNQYTALSYKIRKKV